MKKALIAAVVLLAAASTAFAQEKLKFGTVPDDLLRLTTYENDTTAAAVILYKQCDVYYDYVLVDFVIHKEYTYRIKILKQAGVDWATFEIPYYAPKNKTSDEKELVNNISGFTHNLVDGKVVKTKLSKEYIFDEETSDNHHTRKITFPNVKVGSVIELKYKYSSPYYHHIDDYHMQSSIPVAYARYELLVPSYFRFSKRIMGYENIAYSERKDNISFHLRSGSILSTDATRMVFDASNLPAFNDDSFVWNKNDYIAKVKFELVGVIIPGVYYKDYAYTWDNVDKQLRESERFGKQLRVSGLLKDELAALPKGEELATEDRLNSILSLVKANMQWNEKDQLFMDSPKAALKKGVGSSAEMNAVLISLLRDAGFEANPVVMSLRGNGRMFATYPSIDALNYFIVRVEAGGTSYYMDASSKYGSVNTIPTGCMVQEARCLYPTYAEFVDLRGVGRVAKGYNITATFNADGVLGGVAIIQRRGVEKSRTLALLEGEKAREEYVEELGTPYSLTVTDYSCEKNEGSSGLMVESFAFENPNVRTGDEHIYLNPLIMPFHTEALFKAETRKLPIEFSYPYDYYLTSSIELPEGYVVEELPTSEGLYFDDDKSISYVYSIAQKGNAIQLSYRVTLKNTVYPASDYELMRDFWNRVVSKNNAMVVLKKVA